MQIVDQESATYGENIQTRKDVMVVKDVWITRTHQISVEKAIREPNIHGIMPKLHEQSARRNPKDAQKGSVFRVMPIL